MQGSFRNIFLCVREHWRPSPTQVALRALGFDVKKPDVLRIIREHDRDNSGLITERDFTVVGMSESHFENTTVHQHELCDIFFFVYCLSVLVLIYPKCTTQQANVFWSATLSRK